MSDMTEQQIKNVSVAFVHVLRTQDPVYEEWLRIERPDNYDEFGDFLKKTMHLASKPTREEIDKMHKHVSGPEMRAEFDKALEDRNSPIRCCEVMCTEQAG